MSAAYFVVLDKDVVFEPFINGKALSRYASEISKACKKNGIKKIDDFCSVDPFDEFDDEDLDLDDDGDDFEHTWFTAKEGLDWAASLLAYVKENPKAFKQADQVVEDLEELQEVLQQAEQAKARRHFELDY